jgi:acetyl-CoA C-acetyltransferase
MAAGSDVYVLGGYQTDFARNWTKENKHFSALMREGVLGALESCDIAPEEVESAPVGNFAAELYCMQGHLGAFFTEVDPAFSGLPTARHEAACASGSIALLAASAEIEAGRYDLQAVVGIEQMKTVSPTQGGAYLGTAAWYSQEADGIEFPFPKLFGRLGDEYDKRYGLKDEHLAEISRINYANGKRNPNAQTRTWYMNKEHALCRTDDNPAVGGRIRIADCSQVTDGAVCVFLASRDYAEKWARGQGRKLGDIPRIKGWGHNTARLKFDDKVAESADSEYILPHVRSTITSAWKRAGIDGVGQIDAIETHEEGWLEIAGKHPINPSGGLIGAGHPVGATGVRQLLDCYLQVTGQAGDYQVEGASTAQTLNIGGSGTTSVSFILAN